MRKGLKKFVLVALSIVLILLLLVLILWKTVPRWLPSLAQHWLPAGATRSEEHTSELQSHSDLHSFPTRRSSDLVVHRADPAIAGADFMENRSALATFPGPALASRRGHLEPFQLTALVRRCVIASRSQL